MPDNETTIAVTGCGMVTPPASGSMHTVIEAVSQADPPGDDGFGVVSDSLLAQVADVSKELASDHASALAGAALMSAIEDADFDLKSLPNDRIGLVLGSAFAGQLGMIAFAGEVREQSARFVSPIHFPQTVGNYVAGVMSRAFGIRGPNLTLAAGESSGLNAIAKACALLADRAADVIIAGGFEAMSEDLLRGFWGSSRGQPWSEGACVFVLQRAEDADSGNGHAAIRDWRATDWPESYEPHAWLTRLGCNWAAGSAMRLAAELNTSQVNKDAVVRHGATQLSVLINPS